MDKRAACCFSILFSCNGCNDYDGLWLFIWTSWHWLRVLVLTNWATSYSVFQAQQVLAFFLITDNHRTVFSTCWCISVCIRQLMRSDLGSPLICPRPVISSSLVGKGGKGLESLLTCSQVPPAAPKSQAPTSQAGPNLSCGWFQIHSDDVVPWFLGS